MKLTTIWTLRGLPIQERFNRTGEWLCRSIAHKLPKKIAYWSFIDTTCKFTVINPNAIVPDIRVMDVIKEF